jgi:hypothetical protein
LAGQQVPDLDTFLTGRKKNPCAFVRGVPPELRAEIDEKVKAGVRSWTAFERWLAACGHSVGAGVVMYHYVRCRDDDA